MQRPEPIGRIAGAAAYRRAAPLTPVDLRLDGNEGPLPPRKLLAELTPEILRRYPSTDELARELAERHGVDPGRVLVTAGADEGLDRVFRAFLDERRNVVIPEPTFEMLPRYAKLVGAEMRSVPWLEGGFPCDGVLDRVDADTGALFVVSPNNPTGLCATADDVARIARGARRAVVVVDQAYAEFDADGLTEAAVEFDNVVVTRTLSKAWGLAGLRVGYLIGTSRVVAALAAAGSPYAVSGASVALALAALRLGDARVAEFVRTIEAEREPLTAQLRRHGFEVWPSRANFVLVRGERAGWLVEGLRGFGIAVRAFEERAQLRDCVRVTLPGEPRAFARLERAIDGVLAPAVILVHADTAELPDGARHYRGVAEPGAIHREWDGSPAWFLTDSPEFVRAARAAGLLPIGLAPRERAAELLQAGAATVLATIEDLGRLR